MMPDVSRSERRKRSFLMYPNDDVVYAQQRLVDTIIRYHDKAVTVTGVELVNKDKPLFVTATEILSGDIIRDEIDNFNLVPVSLGYVNHIQKKGISSCFYMTRLPLRHDWRQGLRPGNVQSQTDGQGFDPWVPQDIAKTIEGSYPQLDTVFDLVEDGKSKVAWCRDFHIDGEKNIFYRGYGKIGNFIDRAKNYLLDNKFGWVEEALKEAL